MLYSPEHEVMVIIPNAAVPSSINFCVWYLCLHGWAFNFATECPTLLACHVVLPSSQIYVYCTLCAHAQLRENRVQRIPHKVPYIK